VTLNFYLDGYRFSDEFMLIPGPSESAIIGAATLQKWRMGSALSTMRSSSIPG
jgi:hypothetical protein